MNKPIVAITMGDPSGIGPEIVIKALCAGTAREDCRTLLIGDPEVFMGICRLLRSDLRINPVQDIDSASFAPSSADVLCPEGARIGQVPWGKLNPAAAQAAMLCLREAFELALQGQVHGVVSAPLNKEAFHLAGYHYADELAYLAELTGSKETFMFGVANGIWTVPIAEHVAFKDIPALIRKERILSRIQAMHRALKMVGIAEPRIAVAALNVHAGEGGIYGREELDEIGPAIEEARKAGINALGPVPADTVFPRALEGAFDGIVFMYHDQANIARKLQPRSKGATLFMGLPVACGTTAHGTAFDIAGKGIADPGSLELALFYTARFARAAHAR